MAFHKLTSLLHGPTLGGTGANCKVSPHYHYVAGHEQNELDEILRELLGDTHNAGAASSSTTSSSHRQQSVTKTTTVSVC